MLNLPRNSIEDLTLGSSMRVRVVARVGAMSLISCQVWSRSFTHNIFFMSRLRDLVEAKNLANPSQSWIRVF